MGNELLVYHYQYLHNTLGHFFRGLASWVTYEFLNEMTEVVIGTYDKAVQHYETRKNSAGEQHRPSPPFVAFNPLLDFIPDSQAGRFLYGYPNYSMRQAADIWKPNIYDDGNVLISPVLNRYRGTIEIIIFCRSIYEAIDLRLQFLQWFSGGEGRIIYPKNIESNIIIPESFYYYNYSNPYTQEEYTLDWTNNTAEAVFFKTLNSNFMTIPGTLRPWLRLMDVSDGNELYGGDDLASHKLSVNIEWECDIPTHLVLLADSLPNSDGKSSIDFGINVGSVYIPNMSTRAPKEILNVYLDNMDDVDNHSIYSKDYVYNNRYDLVITSDILNSINTESSFNVTVPVDDYTIVDKMVHIYHESGELNRDYEYEVHPDNVIKFNSIDLRNREIEENDVFYILIYKEDI